MSDDPLELVDEWFGAILDGFAPPHRKRAQFKIGQALRRANLDRQRRNVEPDGSPMEKRKSRLDRRGRVRAKASGKMFRKLRRARNWAIQSQPDSVEVAAKGGTNRIGRVHHFGLRGFVGRTPDGRKVFTRYPERKLLGADDADRSEILDIVLDMLDPEG